MTKIAEELASIEHARPRKRIQVKKAIICLYFATILGQE